HEIEGQEIGLLIVAARGDLSRRALDDYAAVEFRELGEFVRGDAVVDGALYGIGVRRRKFMLVEFLRSHDALPRTAAMPTQLRVADLVGLAILIENELCRFARLLWPTANALRSRRLHHGATVFVDTRSMSRVSLSSVPPQSISCSCSGTLSAIRVLQHYCPGKIMDSTI